MNGDALGEVIRLDSAVAEAIRQRRRLGSVRQVPCEEVHERAVAGHPRLVVRREAVPQKSRLHLLVVLERDRSTRVGVRQDLVEQVEPDDFAERVAVHRDVWAPSRVTESSYANVQASWPYRASLDCVVEAPDGRGAAYCLLWPDDENRVGELEPVGVRDEFRRRGLGAAVCTFALRRWHEEGGRQAIVYCVDDVACGLYESIGFRRHATLVGYSR